MSTEVAIRTIQTYSVCLNDFWKEKNVIPPIHHLKKGEIMSNTDRICELLTDSAGLDDDEISHRTGIHPRQQVNQICRRLAKDGVIRRTTGPSGKIVNTLISTSPSKGTVSYHSLSAAEQSSDYTHKISDKVKDKSVRKQEQANMSSICAMDPCNTLILIPCSGRKEEFPGSKINGPTIIDSLPHELALELRAARKTVASRSNLDDSTMVPAWQRYNGMLYSSAKHELTAAMDTHHHIVILSGGYGLLLANEPIGTYDMRFKPSWWPPGLLERILMNYVNHHRIEHVLAIVSSTTSYRKLVQRVDWDQTDIDSAYLLMPEEQPGAMVKAPRAQGQALAAFLTRQLSASWRSSDGLSLHTVKIL